MLGRGLLRKLPKHEEGAELRTAPHSLSPSQPLSMPFPLPGDPPHPPSAPSHPCLHATSSRKSSLTNSQLGLVCNRLLSGSHRSYAPRAEGSGLFLSAVSPGPRTCLAQSWPSADTLLRQMIKRLRRPAEPTLHDLYQYGFGPRELPASQLLAGDVQS